MTPKREDVQTRDEEGSPGAATYVYCLARSPSPADLSEAPAGLPGADATRCVTLGGDLWLVAASVSEQAFGEAAITAGLQDLDWVSERALAHEAVVEHVFRQVPVVPLTLFTVFRDDERAAAQLGGRRESLLALFERLEDREEFGLRIHFDAARAARPEQDPASRPGEQLSGRDYLLRKKQERDRPRRQAAEARTAAESLLERLETEAEIIRRKPLPESPGALLGDAACLVRRDRRSRFETFVESESRRLGDDAPIVVTLSGPFPPYHFVDGDE